MQAQPHPSDQPAHVAHNTHTTICMKPSDNLQWHEMHSVIAVCKHTLKYIVGISSVIWLWSQFTQGIGFLPQMRDAKERDTQASNCIQSCTHTKIWMHKHIHRMIYLLQWYILTTMMHRNTQTQIWKNINRNELQPSNQSGPLGVYGITCCLFLNTPANAHTRNYPQTWQWFGDTKIKIFTCLLCVSYTYSMCGSKGAVIVIDYKWFWVCGNSILKPQSSLFKYQSTCHFL